MGAAQTHLQLAFKHKFSHQRGLKLTLIFLVYREEAAARKISNPGSSGKKDPERRQQQSLQKRTSQAETFGLGDEDLEMKHASHHWTDHTEPTESQAPACGNCSNASLFKLTRTPTLWGPTIMTPNRMGKKLEWEGWVQSRFYPPCFCELESLSLSLPLYATARKPPNSLAGLQWSHTKCSV